MNPVFWCIMWIISPSELSGEDLVGLKCLVFNCCITNHHTLGLKSQISYLSFCESEVWARLSWVLCFGSHEATIKLSAGAQNLVPWSCRTEGFPFLLAVSWSPSSAPRGHSQFLAMMGLPTKAAHNMAACFYTASKGARDARKTSATILCNVIISSHTCNHVQSITVYCWEASDRPHTQGTQWTLSERQEAGILPATLRVCLPRTPNSFKPGSLLQRWTPFLPAEIKAWLFLSSSPPAT